MNLRLYSDLDLQKMSKDIAAECKRRRMYREVAEGADGVYVLQDGTVLAKGTSVSDSIAEAVIVYPDRNGCVSYTYVRREEDYSWVSFIEEGDPCTVKHQWLERGQAFHTASMLHAVAAIGLHVSTKKIER